MGEQAWAHDFDPLDDPEELRHLLSVLDSFRAYRRLAHFNGTHVRRQAFYSLPQEHWKLLSQPPFSVLDSLSKLDDLIDSNAEIAEAIFAAGFQTFLAPKINSEWVASIVPERHGKDPYKVFSIVMDNLNVQASQNDLEKARGCVNQFYREWSSEGAVERTKCFGPIMAVLEDEFDLHSKAQSYLDRSELRVLIPGAGLGRLVFDVCHAGFTVEGNEISYHELMASSLALNYTTGVGQFKLAPFALNGSNHVSRTDQFQTFEVPDVHPATELAKSNQSKLPSDERMSMSTGDFCVVYSKPDYADVFDAVTTVFFIDTAPNIIRYIEAVRNCLKPGGLWINLGPLLWHHANRKEDGESKENKEGKMDEADSGIADPGSVELTNEEVVALVEHLGFIIEKQECGKFETGYISNPKSMLRSTYWPSHWVARKK